MGVAMIAVMLFHQRFIGGHFFDLFHRAGHYGVDIFFFLSGFGIWFSLDNNKQGGALSFYARRLWRIGPYCLVAGWVTLAMAVAKQEKIGLEFCLLSLTGTQLWYIRSILIFYLLAPLLYKGIKTLGTVGRIPLLVGTLLLIAADVVLDKSSEPLWSRTSLCATIVHWTFIRFPVFVLGMLIAWLGTRGGIKIIGWKYIAIALPCLAAVLSWHAHAFYMPAWFGIDDCYLPLAAVVPLICALLAWIRSFAPNWLMKAVEWMGLYSLEIYLVHDWCYRHVPGHSNNPLLGFLVAVAISFLAAFGLRKATNFLLSPVPRRPHT